MKALKVILMLVLGAAAVAAMKAVGIPEDMAVLLVTISVVAAINTQARSTP
jgi:F0F1-type ATP synthase assembly protein I